MTDQPTPPPPAYGSTGGTPSAPVKAPPGTDFPGKTLGVVSLVAGIVSYFIFPIIAGIAAIIMGAIARGQSKKAGYKNTPATVGLILGIINVIVWIILVIIIIVVAVAGANALLEKCNELGPGEHFVDGVTYNCPA
jgi:uncharacterized membrane protein